MNEAPTAVDAAFVLAENSADGTVVGSVSASDVDAGRRALLRDHGGRSGRSLRDRRGHRRDHGGRLVPADFETTPVFNLTVTVTDAGGLTDTAAVTVSLTDVNEAPDGRGRRLRPGREQRRWHRGGHRLRLGRGCRATRSPTRSRAGTRAERSRSTRPPARSRSPTRPSSTSRPPRSST